MAITIIDKWSTNPTAVITESREKIISSTAICINTEKKPEYFVVSPEECSAISKLLCISRVDLPKRNSPPSIRITSLPEIWLSKIVNQGSTSPITQTILKSNTSLVSIAKPIPSRRALFLCSTGNLPTRIEMKMILSIPSTISSATNDANATHASGLTTHSNISITASYCLLLAPTGG